MEAPGVLVGTTVPTEEPLPMEVEADTEGVNEGEDVATAVELTPVLLGVLEGVEVGG